MKLKSKSFFLLLFPRELRKPERSEVQNWLVVFCSIDGNICKFFCALFVYDA